MSEVKPVIIGVDFAKADGETTVTLYPASVVEELQAENAKLREENEKYQKLFDEIEQHKKALKLCRKI